MIKLLYILLPSIFCIKNRNPVIKIFSGGGSGGIIIC